MQYSEFFLSPSPSLRLYGWQWLPEPSEPWVGVVCLIHGLGEHSGRYGYLVNHLLQHHYAVTAIDQMGHGQSQGQRGHTRHYHQLLDNIGLLIDKVRGDYPGMPIFLLGHSWGGNQVLNFALRRKPPIRGVIAMSPWLKLAFNPPAWKLLLGRGMKSIFPALSQPNGLVTDYISRDPKAVEAYRKDPLVHDKISAGLFTETYAAAQWALAHAAEFPLPVLLIHGTEDKIISPEGTKAFAEKLHRNVTLKLFEGFYHETHNDLDREAVFAAITDWLAIQRKAAID